MNGARVAVVVPVHDMRRWLGEALASILAQTMDPQALEILVVDDGSTDGSGDLANTYAPRVRCIRQPNRGLAAARNAGLAATRAPLVQLLDADDRLHPDKLAVSLGGFDDPRVGVVYTGCRFVDESGAALPQHGWSRHEGDVLEALVLGNLHMPHQPLVRRAAIDQAGGFRAAAHGGGCEDWDLWLRIALAGWQWRCVDRALVDYRVRETGMHRNAARMAAHRRSIVAALFARDDLPAPVRALRASAVARVELVAACEHYRNGEAVAGAAAFRAAVRADPSLLGDTRVLRQICRWLLPLGRQSEAGVVEAWRDLGRTLKRMLADLFATPDLEPALRARQPEVRRAFWAAVLRLARKRAVSAWRPSPRVVPDQRR